MTWPCRYAFQWNLYVYGAAHSQCPSSLSMCTDTRTSRLTRATTAKHPAKQQHANASKHSLQSKETGMRPWGNCESQFSQGFSTLHTGEGKERLPAEHVAFEVNLTLLTASRPEPSTLLKLCLVISLVVLSASEVWCHVHYD